MNIPIFKTEDSFGRSILTCALPDPNRAPDTSDSIFDLAAERDEIYVVNSTLISIFDLIKNSLKLKKKLRFGLEIKVGSKEDYFKHILFAANSNGIKDIFSLYSDIQTAHDGFLPMEKLPKISKNLHNFVPFYDSYVDKNMRSFGTFMPEFSSPPTFALENNNLYVDQFIRRKILQDSARATMEASTILYKNKEDFDAFLTYRLICADKVGGRRPTLDRPDLNGMNSDFFSWEEFLKK